MKDQEKTKDRLIEELAGLRRRIAELEESEARHKQTQGDLRTAKNRLQYLVSSSPAVIYTSKPSGDYGATFISENVSSQLGYEPREFIEDSGFWAAHIHPEDVPRVFDELPGLFDHDYHTHEYRFLYKDGIYRWMRDELKLVRDTDGNPVEIIGYWVDITDRKQAEDARRESEESLAMAQQVAHIGSWDWHIEDDTLTWSDETYRQFGLKPQEIVPTYEAFEDFVHPDDRAPVNQRVGQALSGEKPYSIEARMIRVDGTEWIMYAQGTVHRDEEGKAVRFIGTQQDITEFRKHRDHLEQLVEERTAELQKSEERFRFALKNTPITVFTQDRDLRFTWAYNPSLDFDADAILGKTDADLVGREQAAKSMEITRLVLETGKSIREELSTTLGGETVFYDLTVEPLRDDSGEIVGVACASVDITERKRAEEERIGLEMQLRQQQKMESIGTLAGGVAHEINNPISGIMGYAQLILDKLGVDSPAAEFAGEIIRETERVAIIVRNLLTFARQEKQAHSPAQMSDILEATLSLIRTVMRHDQITLKVDVPEDLPQIKCRSQQIQQVVMNLLTNARDALNERYPQYDEDKIITVTVKEFENAGAKWIRTTVEDHGVGIPSEVRERMFDPFFTTKPREVGTGLGLSISHGIVRDHHGELTAESEVGEYTRFYLDLRVDNGWELSDQ